MGYSHAKVISCDTTLAKARKADTSATSTKGNMNYIWQPNTTEGALNTMIIQIKIVFSSGVISHPILLIICTGHTTTPADDNIIMRSDDTCAYFAKK